MPEGFEAAITERIAIDLYAASVALLARLSSEDPAGCVAEEVIAVALLDEARMWLELEAGQGTLSNETGREAAGALNGLFELFQDHDVLDLFDMREPADAAVAGKSWPHIQLGTAVLT